MAENIQKFRQGAVYGSLAYDLSSTAEPLPDYDAEENWRVQHQTAAPPVEEEQTRVKTAPKARQAVAPFSLIGFALAAVLMVFSLMAEIQLTAVSDEAVSLTGKISELETEETRLLIAYESAFNLTEIEDYAIGELGMQKPRSDQIFYVDSTATDKAEILTPKDGSGGLLDRVSDFVGSLGEYLG